MVVHDLAGQACGGREPRHQHVLPRTPAPYRIEWIARAMRRGKYSYVSLEYALSEYGVIFQIPVDRLIVMTTGRKGTYPTPYGTIEFTHTSRPVIEVLQ